MACQEPFNVTNDQFTASSLDTKLDAVKAVLNQEEAWVPVINGQDQWLQIDLHRQILVSGVVIQGRPDIKEWVTRYQVEYAQDGLSWETVTDESASTEVCIY